MMADGKYNTQTNDGVENKKVGDEQQSSLSSSVRERRSRESHSKSLTSTSSSHVRSRGRSQPKPKRSQSISALVDEDGVVCPIEPQRRRSRSNNNNGRVRFYPTTSSTIPNSNSLPTLSTRGSSSASTISSLGLLNQDSKYKVCPNITQRHLNESIMVSSTATMDMGINNKSDDSNQKSKSDLGSSELTLLTSNVQGKGVTRSSEKDKGGGTGTFLPTLGVEDKETRRSPCEDQCKDEGKRGAASDWKEGKGIMLCMPVTEVQQQLEPPSHNEQLTNQDELTSQVEQEDDELEIRARRLRRCRSREQVTRQSSRSRSLDINDRRPDPEGFPCQGYSRQATSTRHQHNGKSSVKPKDRLQEPEEKEGGQHAKRRPRRPRRSSDTKHIARSSSFTYGGNGHQVPPPPPPLMSEQNATTSPPKRHNSAPDFQQLLESVAAQKSKVGNNRVNKAVNLRQDDETLSTVASSTIPQGQVIKESQILRDPQLPDVRELPPSMTTDGNAISSYLSPCEEVNLNNYDKRGFCVVHPHVRLRKKKFFKRLSLSLQLNCMDLNGIGVSLSGPGSSSDEYNDPEEDGWKIITSVCPECCTDELRRTQLALAAIQRQQQLCQPVESELNTSHQSVTEHQQHQTTVSSGRVATLDMLSRLPSLG